MPHPRLCIQEALVLLEEISSDTESVLSDDSTDDDCAPPQFPTESPPDNFDEVSDEADNDIHLLGHSQLANATWKKKTACNSAKFRI
ncbi:hypothetical protein NPIL_461961 [Nephila pilipes]|uniref:Uncharacterized protein n=1 Tax=Nephila pilipes TaxID=299642 RepID=A0A8X6TFT1_NEPPI|nr:hypothetical protein NPIL_461961 [Nephila pilipes]